MVFACRSCSAPRRGSGQRPRTPGHWDVEVQGKCPYSCWGPDTDGHVANRAGGLFRVRSTRRPGRPELGMRRFPCCARSGSSRRSFQDVDVVGEAVQQRAGQSLRSEHLGPLVEGQVGGHQDGAALVALAEDLEEQFRPGGGTGGRTSTHR